MLELVKFVVYYVYGNVRTTPVGADLSEFESVEWELYAPQIWSLSQLKLERVVES
jgi:hypothetical protein